MYQSGPQHRIMTSEVGGQMFPASSQYPPNGMHGGHVSSSYMADVITPTGEYGVEMQPGQEVPIWMSEHNLGDAHFSQFGLEAFMVPQQYEPQIW